MIVRAEAEQGRFDKAKQAVDELIAQQKRTFDEAPMMIDYYLPNYLFLLLRFQRWDDILKEPVPETKMFMTNGVWHFARVLALAAKGRQTDAATERTAFSQARSKIPRNWMWMFNPADKIMGLAETILKARLAANEKEAVENWRRAVIQQDALAYDEPPAWYYPVRESLGGALLRTGQPAEAEAIFRRI